jgi:hypothetical protein
MTADAYWEKVIRVSYTAKPDDIYQATSLVHSGEAPDDISPDTVSVLPQLDGETPLSIAAEKVSTSDLKQFLDEIGILAERKAVELVSPAQATTVLYASALQSILRKSSRILGIRTTRRLFNDSKEEIADIFQWLAYVGLEEGVDVEIKSSLNTAAVKGSITPDALREGFGSLFQRITKKIGDYLGAKPVKSILDGTRMNIEKQFPRASYDIEWESLKT